MTDTPTGPEILDLPLPENDSGADTVRGYLVALLATLWERGEGYCLRDPGVGLMTDTPAIRTHQTTVVERLDRTSPNRALVPDDWTPNESVLVVAGLPEGCELRRLCDVPAHTWEYLSASGVWRTPNGAFMGDLTGLVVCRPAQPATEKVDPVCSGGELCALGWSHVHHLSAHPRQGVEFRGAFDVAPAPQPETDEPPAGHWTTDDDRVPYPLFEGDVDVWTPLDDGKGEVHLIGTPLRPPNPNDWGRVVVFPAEVERWMRELVRGSQATRPDEREVIEAARACKKAFETKGERVIPWLDRLWDALDAIDREAGQ